MSSSKTRTAAPNDKAVFMACSPTIPAPKITTFAGGTPDIPPNKTLFPRAESVKYSAAVNIATVPAISLIIFTTVACLLTETLFCKLANKTNTINDFYIKEVK